MLKNPPYPKTKLGSPREFDEVDKSLLVHLFEEVHAPLVSVVTLLVVEDIEGDQRGEETDKDE